MSVHNYTINVKEDFLERQSKATPIQALSELIWNSLDADAYKVEIFFDRKELNASSIIVRDNGHGIPFDEAPVQFANLGGSWKKSSLLTKTQGRELHGKDGKGRFKVFSLGRVVDWNVTYKKNPTQKLYEYTISTIGDNLTNVQITDEKESKNKNTGVEAIVSELYKDYKFLETDTTYQELTEIFAIYLMNYRDIYIYLLGKSLDPTSEIYERFNIPLNDIVDGENNYTATMEVIVWKNLLQRSLFLCNNKGFPLLRLERRFHIDNYQFSAYLQSDFINTLHENNALDVGEMNRALSISIEEGYEKLKSHFKEKAALDAMTVVEEWKKDNIYPYQGNATNTIDVVERQVFDMVAIKINKYLPDFSTAPRKSKAYHLRMLKQAIEKSPEELQLILNEVLDLPLRKQRELADLLKETSLSAIISASKLVADRLKFIMGLEAILYDVELKKHLKERSQLHKIIAENTWIFGEEYNLSVNDKSLTQVLKKHKQIIGEETVIDDPVKHISKERGIVDLMLSRAIRNHRPSEYEHLIVELKAPRIKIGSKEITQIENYAFSVKEDERFRNIDIKWAFWVLSDDLDKYAKNRDLGNGKIYDKDNLIICVKVWSNVIEENRARLQFFQEKLEHQVDQGEALSYLKETYETFLKDLDIDNHETDAPKEEIQ